MAEALPGLLGAPYLFQGQATPASLRSHWMTVGLHGLEWRLGYAAPAP